MNFMVNIDIKELPKQISYGDKILLIGSCFTEHIGNSLEELKFSILQNPNGILFDPISVCRSLVSCINEKKYNEADLFQYNELWQSWQHHSRFSNIDKSECLRIINESQHGAHEFLKNADWIIITLGSSFSYRLVSPGAGMNAAVANCHRAPAQWFNKHLLGIEEIISEIDECIKQLFQFNKKLNIIFTVSPVRHIRDGVVDNNRSKARLIESVHHVVNKSTQLHYFPAYELVIDVLRDYRFYDADLVHPNYMATEFVLEKFSKSCISRESQQLMKEIREIVIARKHKAFQPATLAHQQFLQTHFKKVSSLQRKYPLIDLKEELVYFSQT
jgi:GSCFA family